MVESIFGGGPQPSRKNWASKPHSSLFTSEKITERPRVGTIIHVVYTYANVLPWFVSLSSCPCMHLFLHLFVYLSICLSVLHPLESWLLRSKNQAQIVTKAANLTKKQLQQAHFQRDAPVTKLNTRPYKVLRQGQHEHLCFKVLCLHRHLCDAPKYRACHANECAGETCSKARRLPKSPTRKYHACQTGTSK